MFSGDIQIDKVHFNNAMLFLPPARVASVIEAKTDNQEAADEEQEHEPLIDAADDDSLLAFALQEERIPIVESAAMDDFDHFSNLPQGPAVLRFVLNTPPETPPKVQEEVVSPPKPPPVDYDGMARRIQVCSSPL